MVVLVSNLLLLMTITLRNGNWRLLFAQRKDRERIPFNFGSRQINLSPEHPRAVPEAAGQLTGQTSTIQVLSRTSQTPMTFEGTLLEKINIMSLAHPLEKIFYLMRLLRAPFPVW